MPQGPINPEIREILDNLRKNRGFILTVPLLLLAAIGAYSSFYTVQPEEEAVVKRFGKVIGIKEPGLHFKIPFGIDRIRTVPTARVLKEEFGFRTTGDGERTRYQKDSSNRDESLMLTGDLKVIDVEWVVQFRIGDPDKYLHRARDPVQTLRDTSEAVMRRIVGNSLGSDVLTEKRAEVATAARIELQEILDRFDVGIQISTIELQDVTPPELVKPAFNEVNQAEQERERLVNEAEKRRNQVIPRAEGQAKQLIAEAQGYALERVNGARGEAARFEAILAEYRKVPDVTRRRLYLEMIDRVLPTSESIYFIGDRQLPPIPFLNIGGATPSTLSPKTTR
ncbi:MAG: FtsH protease activity modulator HflK [Opitutaceae bacterium]